MTESEVLEAQLIRHEGFRSSAYTDSLGFLTIGIGRCIDAKRKCGITLQEALYLLRNDINRITDELTRRLTFFETLDNRRRGVLINMAFQLGIGGLLGFKKTLDLIARKEYSKAAQEMLNSNWAKQTPARANELSRIMKGTE